MTQNRGDEQRSRRRGEKGDAPTEQEKKEQRKRDKAILNGVLDDLRHKLLKGVRERMVATPIEVEDEAPAAETPTEQPASPTAAEQMADASFIENPPKPEPPAQPTAEPGASSSLLHLPGMTPFLGLTDYYE
jgi:hypothetical protein